MAFFAWTQDVPIDAEMYGEIADRIGDTPMPGLLVHLALENADKSVSYLDVWESEESASRRSKRWSTPRCTRFSRLGASIRPANRRARRPLSSRCGSATGRRSARRRPAGRVGVRPPSCGAGRAVDCPP